MTLSHNRGAPLYLSRTIPKEFEPQSRRSPRVRNSWRLARQNQKVMLITGCVSGIESEGGRPRTRDVAQFWKIWDRQNIVGVAVRS